MRRVIRITLGAVLVAATAGSTCPGGSGGVNVITPDEVQGTYTLGSYAAASSATQFPPDATGDLTLTTTRYYELIHLTGQPDQVDSGTYSIFNGSSSVISEMSDVSGYSLSGTIERTSNGIRLNMTATGGHVVTVWNKN